MTMTDGFEPLPFEDTPEPFTPQIEGLREDILLLADDRRRDAHQLDAQAAGRSWEHYLVTEDRDVPFLSDCLKITPAQQPEHAHGLARYVKELYLYLPQLDPMEHSGEKPMPNLIFLRVITDEGVVLRFAISKHSTAVFLPKDEMRPDTGPFETRNSRVEAEDLFPGQDASEQLESQSHYLLLDELATILRNKTTYRLRSQAEAQAA